MRGLVFSMLLGAATLFNPFDKNNAYSQISHIPQPPEIVDSRITIDSIVTANYMNDEDADEDAAEPIYDSGKSEFTFPILVLYDPALLKKQKGFIDSLTARIFDDANQCFLDNRESDGMRYNIRLKPAGLRALDLGVSDTSTLDPDVVLDILYRIYPDQRVLYVVGHELYDRISPKSILEVPDNEKNEILEGMAFLNGHHMTVRYLDKDSSLSDTSKYLFTSLVSIHEFCHNLSATDTYGSDDIMRLRGDLSPIILPSTGREISKTLTQKNPYYAVQDSYVTKGK